MKPYLRRTIVAVAAFVVLGGIAFAGMRMFMAPPDDLDLARVKSSANGIYAVEISPEAEPVQRGPLHAWILTVKTTDGQPVENARIAIDGGMPQHGHGLPTAPQVTSHLGDGRYRVEGVKFNMSGWWEFKFAISAPQGDDAVVFNIVL